MSRLLTNPAFIPYGSSADPQFEHGPIEAVLFDKDGTLSHSEPMLEALARLAFLTVWSWPPGSTRQS
jgi:hypothetical protein